MVFSYIAHPTVSIESILRNLFPSVRNNNSNDLFLIIHIDVEYTIQDVWGLPRVFGRQPQLYRPVR